MKVVNCARCGGTHEDVEPEKLEYEIGSHEPVITHWAPCPKNGQPILIVFVEKP